MSDGSAAESGRTALRVAAVVLLVLVVAPFVVTGVPSVIGAEESFVVLSGSMNAEPEPVIQPGDVVIVDGVNPATLEDQDIITFTTGAEEPVTHRIVNVTEQDGQAAFRTKGDANEDADPQLVGPDQIIGEVILVIPLVGHVVNFANTTQGFVLLVLLPIGLLVLSEVWNLVMSPDDSSEGESTTGSERPPPTEGVAETAGAAGAAGTAGAAATAPNANVADGEGETDNDDGPATVSLQQAQMQWIALGLVPVTAAAAYTAFRLQSAWIITVTYASAGLLVLSVLLYLRMRWGAAESGSGSGPTDPSGTGGHARGRGRAEGATAAAGHGGHGGTARSAPAATARPVVEDGNRRDPVVTGRLASVDTGSHVEVAVDSREELVDMALEKGTWVVHDPDLETYFLADGDLLFRYDDGEGTPGTAPDAGTNGTGPEGATAEWDEASGWVSFADEADADASDSEPRSDATDLIPAVTRVDAGESTPESMRGRTPSGPPSAWSDDEVTPAIRRIDGAETEESTETSRSPDETDRAATDGGRATATAFSAGLLGRVVGAPFRVLGAIGHAVLAPPTALYRLVRPDRGDETRQDPNGERGDR